MKKFIHYKSPSEDILCMSNVRGINVVRPSKLPFSFYFGSKQGNKHDIRIKFIFNPERIIMSKAGVLRLHGNWEVMEGDESDRLGAKQIRLLKDFFREYLILFILVWDEFMQEGVVQEYFEGRADLSDILDDIDFGYPTANLLVRKSTSIADLETICRDNNLVDMRGN